MYLVLKTKLALQNPLSQYPPEGIFCILLSKITLPMARLCPTYLLFVCLITMVWSLSAQTPVKVGKDFKEEVLSRQVELLEDVSKKWTVQHIFRATIPL